jgi:hypothetical protein
MRVALAAVLLLSARTAVADESRLDITLEAGSELDTNPHRQTAEPGSSYQPESAVVARAGARLAWSFRPRLGHAVRASGLAVGKKFSTGDDADDEDVAVLAGDLRYEARLPGRPAALAARLSYYDAIEKAGPLDHDFRTVDAAAQLTLLGEGDHRAVLVAGYRLFTYKPDGRYDFAGEHVQLGWRKHIERNDDDEVAGASVDVGAEYGIQRRVFADRVRVDTCPPDADLASGCITSADATRVDFVHVAATDLTWSDERIYAARYELHADLSNSFGQSLLRHRLELSATAELPADVLVTVRAVVQYNQFLDPLLLSRDIGLLTIEDENRNALTVHATRDFGARLAGEARVTIYANEFATQALEFRRQTAYVGILVRL